MTISRSSAFSINVLLIFDMHDLNGALLLIATSFSALLSSFSSGYKIYCPFHNNMHHYSHKNLILR